MTHDERLALQRLVSALAAERDAWSSLANHADTKLAQAARAATERAERAKEAVSVMLRHGTIP